MKIRNLEKKDIPSCLKLLEQLTVVGDFDYISICEKILNNSNIHIFVAESENKIVGMATIVIEQKFIHKGGRVGHIEDVVVDKEYRNLNIGRSLIEKCIETAKMNDCYKAILDCDEKNVLFYNKCGFKNFGISMKILLQ